jgi:hypothetical protein
MDKDYFDGCWGVFYTAMGKFIGKVVSWDEEGNEDGDARKVILCPAFDHATPMQPVPDPNTGRMGMTKAAIVTPLDVTSDETTITLWICGFMLFSNMKKEDVNKYKSLVKSALDIAQGSRLEELGITRPKDIIKGNA